MRKSIACSIFFLRLALCLLVACIQPAAAAGEPHTLRIATSGDYAPFSVAGENGADYHGFDIAVAEAFAAQRGYTIEWTAFRWPDLLAAMRGSAFDIAMSGITVRPERSAAGRFSVPVVDSGAVLLYRASAFTPAATGLATFDRAGVRVAVNRGGHLERVTRAHFHHATITAIDDNAGVRRALLDGEADAVVTDTLEAPRWLHGTSGIATFGPWTADRKAYWLPPARGELALELDAWLLAREADGSLARWRRQYFGEADLAATATPLAALLAACDERLGLMPWVALHKAAHGRPIEDRTQEARVLSAAERAVTAAARERGLPAPPAAVVQQFFHAQIEAAKQVQRQTFASATDDHTGVPDLDTVLRPALQRIGARMAYLIVSVHHTRVPTGLRQLVSSALGAHGLDDDASARIAAALAALAAPPQAPSPEDDS